MGTTITAKLTTDEMDLIIAIRNVQKSKHNPSK